MQRTGGQEEQRTHHTRDQDPFFALRDMARARTRNSGQSGGGIIEGRVGHTFMGRSNSSDPSSVATPMISFLLLNGGGLGLGLTHQ